MNVVLTYYVDDRMLRHSVLSRGYTQTMTSIKVFVSDEHSSLLFKSDLKIYILLVIFHKKK